MINKALLLKALGGSPVQMDEKAHLQSGAMLRTEEGLVHVTPEGMRILLGKSVLPFDPNVHAKLIEGPEFFQKAE